MALDFEAGAGVEYDVESDIEQSEIAARLSEIGPSLLGLDLEIDWVPESFTASLVEVIHKYREFIPDNEAILKEIGRQSD
jgi:hypothetical protein